jgi:predicted MFS family arabinose efflux permease
MWPFYAYKLLADFLLIVPVMVPLYRDGGLTATEIFTVQAIYSALQLLCEVPSGYLADVMGRKRTLVLGAVLFVAGLCLYAVAHGFWTFALAEAVLGVGGGMRSGTDSALLYDTLKERGRTHTYTEIEGRAESLTRVGTAISSVLGGVLAAVSVRLPFYVNIGTGLLMLAVTLLLREPARDKAPRQEVLPAMAAVVQGSLRNPRMVVLMAFSGLVMGTGITAIWGYFLFLERAGVSLALFGVVFASVQLSSAAGAHRAFRVEKGLGSRGAILAVVGMGGALLPFAVSGSAWLVLLACLHAFLWGVSTPLFLERINRLSTSDVRATTLSTNAMLGRVAYMAISVTFGVVVDRWSVGVAFGLMAAAYLVVATALATLLLRQETYQVTR